jgi:hypothetical protein
MNIRRAKTWLTNTTLSTNMTAKKFDAEAYVLSGLDFMTLSIDGATQAVYEKYRRKGDIETIFRKTSCRDCRLQTNKPTQP